MLKYTAHYARYILVTLNTVGFLLSAN